MILTKYLPGATARNENAPVSSERVVREILVSLSSRVICALEMVASSVPESTEALGASGSWMAGVAACCCWARRSISQGTIRRRRTQRSLVGKGVTSRLGTTHIYRRLSKKSNARKNAGGCGKGHGNYL